MRKEFSFNMEHLFISLNSSDPLLSILLHILMMITVSIVPFAPIPVVATIIGTHHSFITGFCINLGGTVTGSLILYQLSNKMLRKLANKVLLKFQHLDRFITLIQTNGFLAILIGRLVPILPSAGVSLIAGISGVTFVAFTTATVLGKIPIILAFSLAGNQLAAGNWYTLIIIALYLGVLILIGGKVKKRWRT